MPASDRRHSRYARLGRRRASRRPPAPLSPHTAAHHEPFTRPALPPYKTIPTATRNGVDPHRITRWPRAVATWSTVGSDVTVSLVTTKAAAKYLERTARGNYFQHGSTEEFSCEIVAF